MTGWTGCLRHSEYDAVGNDALHLRSGTAPLVEASAAGTTQREYVWLDDMPLAPFTDLHMTSSNRCKRRFDLIFFRQEG